MIRDETKHIEEIRMFLDTVCGIVEKTIVL